MFTKTTATIILTIFCLPQTGFAGPALNRSEATGLGPAQNLRAEAAAQGKVGAEVGDAVIATAQSVATPQHIKTKLKGGVYKIDFRLPTGQTITMRMNVQSLEADNDRILEIESIIGGVDRKSVV